MLKAKADGGMKFDDFLKQGVLEWVLCLKQSRSEKVSVSTA